MTIMFKTGKEHTDLTKCYYAIVRLFTTGNLIQMKSYQSSKLTRSVFKPTSSLILVNINLEKFCFLLGRVSQ